MQEKIFEFFSKYIQLTEEEKKIIADTSSFIFYPAGHILLREGQYARECFFVVKGLVRTYRIHDGEEQVTEFFSELSSINPVSYITGEPSTYYIACVEDCVISTSDQNKSKDFFESLPRLKDIAIQFMSDINAKQALTYADFKHLEPEQRYKKLLDTRPDLFNRVPQYMIASYLGIKPQSLSRIRKRLRDKKAS